MAQLGTPIQILPSDVYDISSTRELELGQLAQTDDGKKYRYAKAGGTALLAGKLAVAATIVANHENVTVAAAAAVGATEVTVTLGATAVTANYYTGGSMTVNDEAGEGITYRVASHPAADSAATLVVSLLDEEGVQVALTTSSQVSLQKNSYDAVVISAADQGDMPVGIANVAVTADYYFWAQTGGDCSALADATIAVGAAITTGSTTGGAVEAVNAAGEVQIGVAKQAGVDTEYRLVSLMID